MDILYVVIPFSRQTYTRKNKPPNKSILYVRWSRREGLVDGAFHPIPMFPPLK